MIEKGEFQILSTLVLKSMEKYSVVRKKMYSSCDIILMHSLGYSKVVYLGKNVGLVVHPNHSQQMIE